jgi:hypothetical protein
MPTEAAVMIIILEVALIVKLSGLCWAQYKENKQLKLEVEIERLNETIWDLTEGRGY